jgi:CO/xanthine dehydrogenase Mo-binding subunit
LALPDGDGVKLYSQGQGVYIDRSQIARFLDIPEEKVKVVQVQNGGGFGGKEDLTCRGMLPCVPISPECRLRFI